MPAYVVLIKWTDEGRKTVTDTLNRTKRARDVWKKLGAGSCYCCYRYDFSGS
jgi:uncharacterized protein with GYD domain